MPSHNQPERDGRKWHFKHVPGLDIVVNVFPWSDPEQGEGKIGLPLRCSDKLDLATQELPFLILGAIHISLLEHISDVAMAIVPYQKSEQQNFRRRLKIHACLRP